MVKFIYVYQHRECRTIQRLIRRFGSFKRLLVALLPKKSRLRLVDFPHYNWLVRLFLTYGYSTMPVHPFYKNSILCTAAQLHQNANTVKLLLSAGVNINDYSTKCEALYRASVCNRVDTADALLAAGAVASVFCLQDASSKNHTKIVIKLLNSGTIYVDMRVAGDRTSLHRASIYGNIDVIKVLLAAGARADIKDFCGITPIRLAAIYHHIEIFDLLFDSLIKSNKQK